MRRLWLVSPLVLLACSGGGTDTTSPVPSAPTIAPAASPDPTVAVQPTGTATGESVPEPTNPEIPPELLFPTVPEPSHPLDGLSVAEVEGFRAAIESDAQFDIFAARFAYIGLTSPAKADVLAFQPGDPLNRTVSAVVVQGDEVFDVVVDPATRTVLSSTPNPGARPAFINSEFSDAINASVADARMLAGFTSRRVTPDQVICLAFSPGAPRTADELGRRMLRVSCYARDDSNAQGFWSRPIEGLVATYDLDANAILSVADVEAERTTPVPAPLPGLVGAPEAGEKPIPPMTVAANNITAEGSSLAWNQWSLRWHVDRRTGLVINNVQFMRPGSDGVNVPIDVLYEASMSDMFVPYQDPDPAWSFRTFLDAGEFGMGTTLSEIRLGLDCPYGARLLGAVIPDELSNSAIKRAACVFEREAATPVLRHNSDTLVANEMVLRSISTVGNYDYITDVVLSLDGSIRFDVSAAGIVLQRATSAQTDAEHEASGDHEHGELVAPGLVGVNHDHYLNFRLDLDVLGSANRLNVQRLVADDLVASGESDQGRTSIWKTESVIQTVEGPVTSSPTASPDAARWLFEAGDDGSGNRPAYLLDPMDSMVSPIAAVTDPGIQRAGWITSPLWVTPYDEDQVYAGGRELPDGTNPDGLLVWSQANRNVDDTDLVAWYTVGFHHVVRSEDLPNMPVHRASFRLVPENIFPATANSFVEG